MKVYEFCIRTSITIIDYGLEDFMVNHTDNPLFEGPLKSYYGEQFGSQGYPFTQISFSGGPGLTNRICSQFLF